MTNSEFSNFFATFYLQEVKQSEQSEVRMSQSGLVALRRAEFEHTGIEWLSSAWRIKFRRICGMKMLCFKAFGNRFKEAVEPLNAAINKVLSTSNMRRRGTVRKVDHMWPNLRLGKPHFRKSCRFSRCLYTK